MENFDNSTPSVSDNAMIFGILAYINILWLVGLLVKPESETAFVKNHVNNGIILSIVEIVLVLIGLIPIVGAIIDVLVGIVVFVFAVLGIIKAIKKEMYELPIIGDKFTIIK